MSVKYILTFAAVLVLGTVQPAFSQAKGHADTSNYKNVIRYNISSGALFGINKCIIFGYERMVSPHQSFSVNIGSNSLPGSFSLSNDSISLTNTKTSTGFNFSVDYRFYLSKENKYSAPHGVYIGPYYSYNHYSKANSWNYEQSGSAAQLVNTNIDLAIHTVGAELGYQFVFWKRVTLDMVLVGPGISAYKMSADVESNLTEAQKQKVRDVLVQSVSQKFPGLNYVFADQHLSSKGTFNTTSIGYRYIVHVGFRF
jgi:hypothetical protein